jgi:hypothetical protein
VAFIHALVISLFLLCFPVDSAELRLHYEKENDRLLVLFVNDDDESFSFDQSSFRISSLGKLHFEFMGKQGRAHDLIALVNDRFTPFVRKLEFGDVAGQFFYLRHLLADYGVIDQGQYIVKAFICEKNNAVYDDELLSRDGKTCLVSNQIEFDK